MEKEWEVEGSSEERLLRVCGQDEELSTILHKYILMLSCVEDEVVWLRKKQSLSSREDKYREKEEAKYCLQYARKRWSDCKVDFSDSAPRDIQPSRESYDLVKTEDEIFLTGKVRWLLWVAMDMVMQIRNRIREAEENEGKPDIGYRKCIRVLECMQWIWSKKGDELWEEKEVDTTE